MTDGVINDSPAPDEVVKADPEPTGTPVPSLPNSVQIGPFVYSVGRETNIKNERGVSLWGQIDYERHYIRVDSTAPHDRARETFFHECLHGIANVATVNLKEREVVALSVGIVDFLLRNPDVVALYMNGKPEEAA